MIYHYTISTTFPQQVVAVAKLQSEIRESISTSVISVSSHEDVCSVEFSAALSLDDKATLDNIVSAHVPRDLESVRADRIAKISSDTNAFITADSRYPMYKQISLTKLQDDAFRTGKLNRAAYIQSGWDWAFSVMGYYYQKEAQISMARTVTAIDAIIFNLAPFELTDPHVSIYAAMLIAD